MRPMASLSLVLACIQGCLLIGSTLKLEGRDQTKYDYGSAYRYIAEDDCYSLSKSKRCKALKNENESLQFKLSKYVFKVDEQAHQIEVSTNLNAIVHRQLMTLNPLLPLSKEINNTSHSVLSLNESIPYSGIYDTITLPSESADTLYLINFSAPAGMEKLGEIELLLNGEILPYLAMDSIPPQKDKGFNRTLIIMNPAYTLGQLSLYAANPSTVATLPLEKNLTAYLNVVKLDNSRP